MPFRIETHLVDERARTVTGPEGPVHVEPQVLQVLLHLIAHRDRAVAKSELLDEVWGGQFVTESALTSRIKAARAALGDSGREQRVIRTVHGFGYQFVAPVTEVPTSDPDPDVAPSTGDAAELPADSGMSSADARTSRANGLPPVHDRLRGRVDELAAVDEMLAEHPLVTLLGPGGMGKTRLAVEVARRRADSDPRPHVFVDLTHVDAGDPIGLTLADALGVDTGQRRNPLAAAVEVLSADPHVLVLDNCEHVWEAVAATVAEIAPGSPRTSVLATSRRPLGLPFERLYRLAPLSVTIRGPQNDESSDSAGPAVLLFRDRMALSGAPSPQTADENAAVREICRRLDGLPLALELAAGRVATFGLRDVIALLHQRLDAFNDSSTVREQRHRTLRATVAWSYDLLGPTEQKLFRTLAALPAGIAMDQILPLGEAIDLDDDPVAALAGLVDASLVVRTEAPSGSRYTQLETLRAFGLAELDRLGEREAVGDAVTDLMIDLLARADDGLNTPDEAIWADRIRREIPNIRAVRRHLRRADRADELVLVSSRLAEWARFRDAVEVWSWSDELCRRCAGDDPRRATALALAAQAAWRRGDIDVALARGAEALELAQDDAIRAQALAELATARMFAGQHEGAVAAWRQQADITPDSIPLGSAALAGSYGGDLNRARDLIAQAGLLISPNSSPSRRAWQLYCVNELAQQSGEGDEAELRAAIALAQQVRAEFIVGVATVTLASMLAARGDRVRAAGAYRDLIGHWLRSGSWTQLWTTLRNVAELLEEDAPELAWLILESADRDEHSSAAVAGAPAERLAALRRRLATTVCEDITVGDRVAVAEATRVALARICEESPRG